MEYELLRSVTAALLRCRVGSEIFDAVGRLSGTNIDSLDPARILPRREVARAIALLRSDLARKWRIEDLARDVALSPSHLTRLFSLQFGVAPGSFLRQLRADRMAELLATTGLTVGETGAAVGWHDLSMASRSFKQRYGVAPSVYAKFHRSRNHPHAEDSLLFR